MAKQVDGHRWNLQFKPRFSKLYNRLDQQKKNRISKAIHEMSYSDQPTKLGEYKKQYNLFAYAVGRRYRIMYRVDQVTHTIDFVSVCDHKSVYMKG